MTADVLLLRFEAVLMSYGGVIVGNLGVTWRMPGRAMLTGLLGNALGYRHSEVERLDSLQRSLRYGVRRDRAGREVVDFQTVDLSQEFMAQGWTTRGVAEGRGGGNRKGTHIRRRTYIADAVYTVAMTLAPAAGVPSIGEIEERLRSPRRPLFVGRRSCIPSTPILVGRHDGGSLFEVLGVTPRIPRSDDGKLLARWPVDDAGEVPGSRCIAVTDDRDWMNQVHVGRRWMCEGWIDV